MSKKILIIVMATVIIAALGLSACTGAGGAAAAGTGQQNGYGNGGSQPESSESAIQGQGRGNSLGDSNRQSGGTGQSNGNGQGGGNGRGQGQGSGQGQGKGQGAGGQGGFNLEPLSEAEANALLRAIEEEYGAQALYQSVLDTFGDVEPFNRIVQSEAQHAAALVRQAEKYGLVVPEYTGAQGLPIFASLAEACQAGVEAEIADAALYDELMPPTTHTDILRVYENLKSASLNSHLPAFEACQ